MTTRPDRPTDARDAAPRRDGPGLGDNGLDKRNVGRDADAGMVLHEEQVRTGVERHASKRIKLRKRVIEEERTILVTVRREEVEVVEEDLVTGQVTPRAIDAHAALGSGAGQWQERGEMILHAERPVVATEWVPVERVRVVTSAVKQNEQVTTEVAREVADIVDETGRVGDRERVDETGRVGDRERVDETGRPRS